MQENCTESLKRECAKGCGPNDLPALCAACERREPYVPSAWYAHIWYLYSLQRGGFPFAADDLSIEEWIDLGVLKDELESRQEQARLHLLLAARR